MLSVIELIIMILLGFLIGVTLGIYFSGVVFASGCIKGELYVETDLDDNSKYLSVELNEELDDNSKYVLFKIRKRYYKR